MNLGGPVNALMYLILFIVLIYVLLRVLGLAF